MDSHLDREHQPSPIAKKFLDELKHRAERIKKAEQSTITGGADGEPILEQWEGEGVWCRKMPDDEQGILRISIGGGKHLPVSLNYCVHRGDRGACIDLLRKALKALEDGPQ